ncbi:ATP-dependent helicase [Anopheles sinensis]|uniref:ATP-dependent helicase n=1 Tax=Anopheles sinensis TaxID=74873 RepID=A0A084VFB3_ANOSI|nr:ATP-dependent helicase [Anopheles sinensis]
MVAQSEGYITIQAAIANPKCSVIHFRALLGRSFITIVSSSPDRNAMRAVTSRVASNRCSRTSSVENEEAVEEEDASNKSRSRVEERRLRAGDEGAPLLRLLHSLATMTKAMAAKATAASGVIANLIYAIPRRSAH